MPYDGPLPAIPSPVILAGHQATQLAGSLHLEKLVEASLEVAPQTVLTSASTMITCTGYDVAWHHEASPADLRTGYPGRHTPDLSVSRIAFV